MTPNPPHNAQTASILSDVAPIHTSTFSPRANRKTSSLYAPVNQLNPHLYRASWMSAIASSNDGTTSFEDGNNPFDGCNRVANAMPNPQSPCRGMDEI